MGYWGKSEELAVKEYIKCNEKNKKDKIYRDKLEKPFEKLVESIIGIYGKKYHIFDMGIEFHTLKLMGLSYIFHKMAKFDPDRINKKGKPIKAYSFFGTILRNYYLELKQKFDLNRKRNINLYDSYMIESYMEQLSYNDEHIPHEKIFLEKIIDWYELHLNSLFQKEDDKKIALAIIKIMKDVDKIECFNKKFIYIQIRELTDITSNHKITPVIKKMKCSYKHLRENFNNYGEVLSGSLSI